MHLHFDREHLSEVSRRSNALTLILTLGRLCHMAPPCALARSAPEEVVAPCGVAFRPNSNDAVKLEGLAMQDTGTARFGEEAGLAATERRGSVQ